MTVKIVKPKPTFKRQDCLEYLTENGFMVRVPQKILKKLEKDKRLYITSMKVIEKKKPIELGRTTGGRFKDGSYETTITQYNINGWLEVKYEINFSKTKGIMNLYDVSELIKY